MTLTKMVNLIIILLFVLLIFNPPNVSGSDWVVFGTTEDDGDVFLFDKESIKHRTKDIVQFCERRDLSDIGRKNFIKDLIDNGAPIGGYLKISHIDCLREIHCLERKTRVLSIINYDSDGYVLDRGSFANPPWNSITSDSIGDDLRKMVCQN